MASNTDKSTPAADPSSSAEGTTIVIHYEAYRRRALSLQSEAREAEEAYEQHIHAYLDYLKTEAAQAGYTLTIDKHESEVAVTYGGPRAAQQQAHDWLQTLPDFWNWIP